MASFSLLAKALADLLEILRTAFNAYLVGLPRAYDFLSMSKSEQRNNAHPLTSKTIRACEGW